MRWLQAPTCEMPWYETAAATNAMTCNASSGKTAKILIGSQLAYLILLWRKESWAPKTLLTLNDRFDEARCIATAT